MQEDKNAIFQLRFPQKLWYLLNMHTDAILWGGTGRTILLNYRILHNYLQCEHSIFKTTNISSFVRQLNLYGFRKVTSHLQDPLCNSCNPYMHEYVHDYFQYGRPELLNKITRKALAMRKNFKPRNVFGNPDQLLYLTPLQKARRNLREALKKAAQGLFMQNPSKTFCNLNFEGEADEPQDELCDNEENINLDWLLAKNCDKTKEKTHQLEVRDSSNESNKKTEDIIRSRDETQTNIIDFKEDLSPQSIDNFPGQFLNMPGLGPVPNEDRSGVELLAEFKIDNDPDQNIIREIGNKENNQNSLNCVLPSISNDHIDDVSMSEKENENLDQYNGEWDLMFNDIIASKETNNESSSDFKELYSQISRTIDLLND